jgi:hypothetical protein
LDIAPHHTKANLLVERRQLAVVPVNEVRRPPVVFHDPLRPLQFAPAMFVSNENRTSPSITTHQARVSGCIAFGCPRAGLQTQIFAPQMLVVEAAVHRWLTRRWWR